MKNIRGGFSLKSVTVLPPMNPPKIPMNSAGNLRKIPVCMWSSLWQILTRVLQTLFAKLLRQKATIMPQKKGLKAAATKMLHLAYG